MHRKTVTGKVCLTPYEKLLKSGVKQYNGEVKDIELPLLHPFKNHPFKVVEDEHMRELVESIKEKGVLSPTIVRRMETGGFEIISGHRRKRACELAGLLTMPVIIKELDDDEATILMVDANIQRENILPSERAFSLQMKMEALKRQGRRRDLEETTSNYGQDVTSDHYGPKLQEDESTSRHDVEKLDEDLNDEAKESTSGQSDPKLNENKLTSGHNGPKLQDVRVTSGYDVQKSEEESSSVHSLQNLEDYLSKEGIMTSGHNVPKLQKNESTSRHDVEKLKDNQDEYIDLTLDHYDPKLTADIVGKDEGLSGRQIQRYIRLTNLTPNLLLNVDKGKIGLVQAVNLSYISEEKQEMISRVFDKNDKSMTVKQAKMLREASESGTLDEETAFNILLGKTAFLRTVTFSEKELKRYFPEEVNSAQIKRFMIGLLNDWKEKP
ncbi:MAG: ParB/RepB/Spo0J family partition protein [Lachnospiraceae bacterium]|nr:ParB/RepB/Spo0J family partition protein [Lachnospiraceae bacterium]